ncbi:MAG: DUF1127 domain-containing protein [Alphaproteobacteria bacterium]
MFGLGVVETWRHWRRVRLTRRELTALNDFQLSDIGMTRFDIERVARGAWPARFRRTP